MTKLLKRFANDDAGAVTVDWMVMCAAIVGLCVTGLGAAQSSVADLAQALSADVTTEEVVRLND